ncbi:MAG: 50S ribosomal protein L16 [Clostridia bacterium]|nr:50S ribosomal protein L16 [Clostridia bacterium]MCQ2564421.1 50S ribosomal protein L16 [Clostridia bacterium]
MLMPKREKRRKQFRGRMTGRAIRGSKLAYGDYGLQSVEPCWVTSNQLEAARVAINRYIKRDGQVWIMVFPDKPITKKPADTRMGSGKGAQVGHVAVVKRDRVVMEVSGPSEAECLEALRLASHKLPCKTRIIRREKGGENNEE